MIRVFRGTEDLAVEAVGIFADDARRAVVERGRFTVALAGGRTPIPIYRELARRGDQESLSVPWERIHLVWGDERMVPPDHEESNFRMARRELLQEVPVPEENVHPVDPAVGSAEAAARAYEAVLRDLFDSPSREEGPHGGARQAPPHLDLVFLGLGEDGHTASLFPGCPALEARHRWVASCDLETLDHPRVTLTLPILNRVRRILFLVTGEEKAEILRRVLEEDTDLPAARIDPVAGGVVWLVDEPAAKRLSPTLVRERASKGGRS